VVSSKGTAPVSIAGRDQQGYITNVPLGANLQLSNDGTLIARTSADTISLHYVIEDWNQPLLSGLEERINIPMQYNNYRLVEIWCWNSAPGSGGTVYVAFKDINADKEIASVAIDGGRNSAFVAGAGQTLRGGTEVGILVQGHCEVPPRGLRTVLVLTR
jgi:hypothetical protein